MDSPPYEAVLAVALAIAPVLLTLFYVFRRHLSRLDGGAVLVLWGLVIVAFEHAGFGRAEFGGTRLRTHAGFHFEMLAAYGLAAFALVGLVIVPLIRRGDRLGWYGLMVLFAIGLVAEILAARVATLHGLSDRWERRGLALWAYPLTWATALALSAQPIFRPGEGRAGSSRKSASL